MSDLQNSKMNGYRVFSKTAKRWHLAGLDFDLVGGVVVESGDEYMHGGHVDDDREAVGDERRTVERARVCAGHYSPNVFMV